MKNPRFFLIAAIGTWMLNGTSSNAATIVEYFNDYGSTSVEETSGGLTSLGSAGDGWAGGWSGNSGPGYQSNSTLSYSATGYSQAGNGTSESDGRAKWSNGGGGSIATRAFSTALTGTIWVSALAFYNDIDDGEVKLYLETNFIGLISLVPRIDAATGTGTFASGTVHLYLARVTIDASGTDDSIDFWVNPDLSTGEGGLGTPNVSSSGADLFGTSLDDIGIAFRRGGSYMDSIRISNDLDGFAKVTSVPEPSIVLLSALGILFFCQRRR